MKIKNYLSIALLSLFAFSACKKGTSEPAPVPSPPIVTPIPPVTTTPALPTTISGIKAILVDKNATDETAALFYNMKVLAKTKIMFGHQDDTKSGFAFSGGNGTSDVKQVTSVFPALYGWDLLDIASFQQNNYYTNQEPDLIRKLTQEAYARGGVNTYSWHYWNPGLSKRPGDGSVEGSNASFYYNSAPYAAVPQILAGGTFNATYNVSLDQVANYVKSLKDANGKAIPIILRLFHEQDGDFFWWGSTHCTPQQYKDLFQYTVKYLRDVKGLHNILFGWSPDRTATTETQYLDRYPGNEYVDVVGMDQYYDLSADGVSKGGIKAAADKLKIVSDYAIKNNKVAALTETGLNKLTKNDWYTTVLLPALTQQKVELSYAMAWSNRADEYFVPYVGSASVADFIKFKNTSNIAFGDAIPNMYTIK